MKKDLKLFATDMDGTFLRSDHTFDHARLQRLLENFAKKGWVFAAASGRSLLALQEVFADFQDQMAFVAENGGVIAVGQDIISTQSLNLEQVQAIVDMLQTMPHAPKHSFLVSGLKAAYALETIDQEFYDFAIHYYPHLEKVKSLDAIEDTLLKVTTNFPPEHIRACEDWLNQQIPFVHATTSGFTSVDIIPAGINKATGLRQLLQHFGWSAENLAAFGDQMNDYEMLEFAGTSYAMSNAIPEIQALADEVIGSNDEEAVFGKLEQLLNMKW